MSEDKEYWSERPGFLNPFEMEPWEFNEPARKVYEQWCIENNCSHGHCSRDRRHFHDSGSVCERDKFYYDGSIPHKFVCGTCAQRHDYSLIFPCAMEDCSDYNPGSTENWSHRLARRALAELGILNPTEQQIKTIIARMRWVGGE